MIKLHGGRAVSAVGVRETNQDFLQTEDGWFIVALRQEDEATALRDAQAQVEPISNVGFRSACSSLRKTSKLAFRDPDLEDLG